MHFSGFGGSFSLANVLGLDGFGFDLDSRVSKTQVLNVHLAPS